MKGYGPDSPPTAACVAPFAAVSTSAGFRAAYDPNGNMALRVEVSGSQRVTYTQEFDAENRLTGVSGGASASFVYDGDGKRVKSDFSGTVTYYIGNWYEKTGTAETKYYYFGGKRVAMRTSAGVTYIHSDQLGSATNTTGASTTTQRYYPWGAQRGAAQVTTPYRFTGQREESTIGLYFYNARWYDPALGRFVQADSLVADQGNPQTLNRYSYVFNNPLRYTGYTDPTGLFTQDEIMKYLGVQTWEEVLALFAKGGRFENNLGWLLVLQEAELGDEVAINLGHAEFAGRFEEEDGNLYLAGGQGKVLANDVGPAGSMYRLTQYRKAADSHGERATKIAWIERNAWKRNVVRLRLPPNTTALEYYHWFEMFSIGLFQIGLGITMIVLSLPAPPIELVVTGPTGISVIVSGGFTCSLVVKEIRDKYQTAE